MSNNDNKQTMDEQQFDFMREVLAAPSPVGFEAAMSYGVIKPAFEAFMPDTWKIHQFKGNAGLVVDTHPNEPERVTAMIIGHADKIRLQVRKIDKDGKVWVNSDSFLPCTLIGHEVKLYAQEPGKPGRYKEIKGATIEALGAIHFSEPAQRSGAKGIKPEMLYLELHVHGEDCQKQVEAMGIRAGDPIILDRPIKRGVSKDTFYGAYLDNGLGCFVVTEIAKILAQSPLKNLRVLYTIATHEEIGRFGSTALAGELKPDILIGSDVNHDYSAAPGIGGKNMNPLAMGKGFSIARGSVTSETLIQIIEQSCIDADVAYQLDVTGRDTGTDAMAAALAGFDCAVTSIGFPIRNMHTISETGHTGDLIAAIDGMVATFNTLDRMNNGKGVSRADFADGHPRLDLAD